MINVSNDYKQTLLKNRIFEAEAKITLQDGTLLNLTGDQIMANGIGVEEAVSNNSSFDVGSVIINKATLIINNRNDDFTKYDFSKAKVILKLGLQLPDGTVEMTDKGYFFVDEPKYNSSLITLNCLDDMKKFDKNYSKSNLVYPTTVFEIVQDACSCCDVVLGIASIQNGNMVIEKRPSDESLTFRQMLQWIGQLICKWFTIDKRGRLVAGWYDREAYESLKIVSGGNFGDELTDVISGGTFGDGLQDAVSCGTFCDRTDYHHIYSLSSSNIDTDDVVITGVKVTEYAESSQETTATYQIGEDGYLLSIDKNQLIAGGTGQQVAKYLGSKLIGLRFRPLSLSLQSNPTIEAGDIALVSDYRGNIYKTFITGTKFQVGGTQSVTCGAKSAARNSADRYSQAAQWYTENKKEIEYERTEREKAIEKLNETLSNSSGMYVTAEKQPDGSTITYLHDKKILEESKNVIKITAKAIGVSNDGGKTWPYGFTLTGEMIVEVLQTVGINASWINTGVISVKDKDGKEVFYVNVETGAVRINADQLTIKGKNVETIVTETQNVIVSNEEPANKEKIWCDTSKEPSVFKKWNGEYWSLVNDQNEIINKVYQDIYTEIDTSAGNIMFKVGEKYYSKDQVDGIIDEMNTKFTQKKDKFLFEFYGLKDNLDKLKDDTDAELTELKSYIHFIDGTILLGKVDDPFKLHIKRNRISFMDNNVEVAYIANHKLYITDGEFTNSIRLRSFKWYIRKNGNMSLG